MLRYWRNTGDGALPRKLWPAAKRATKWMIGNAMGSDGYGLPQYLWTTYDHFGWQKQRAVVYNAHIYLTALRATGIMARAMGDDAVANSTDHAIAVCDGALTRELWNATTKSFRATTGGNQTFTDSLYGQMLSHHNFGSFTYQSSSSSVSKGSVSGREHSRGGGEAALQDLWDHLEYEWKVNEDAYGMRVLSNPVQEDSIWMNGPPTWAYLQLVQLQLARSRAMDGATGKGEEKEEAAEEDEEGGEKGRRGSRGTLSMEEALEPFKRMSENFRTRLRDPWNLRALTHTQTQGPVLERGAPREQGHYGFMLTDLFLLPLLSGVRVDLSGTVAPPMLEIAPTLYPPPFTLPVLYAGVEATISAARTSVGGVGVEQRVATGGSSVEFVLSVAFGAIELPRGALRVCGQVVNGDGEINLREGQQLRWTQAYLAGCGW